MSSLGDIKAHCERHESRMDSAHEKMDRLSSESDSSQGGEAPNKSTFAPPHAPYRPGPNPIVVAVAILAALAVIVVAVMVLLVLPREDSPTDVYKEYVDASNDRDIKRMFDQTVTRFNLDYEQRLENLSDIVFVLDPEIEIVSLGVMYQANMSELQKLTAGIVIDDIESRLHVEVADYCFVYYTVDVLYKDIGQTATFDGEVLCVDIDGDWNLALPGYY